MNIIETRKTLNGECNAWGQGTPCFLIRFAGCNLRCTYCDAQAAQDPDNPDATKLPTGEILDMILNNTPENGIVLITGGEPLLQPHSLLNIILTNPHLCDRRFIVETNGTISATFNFIQENISWVIDCKLPSSGIVQDWAKPWVYAPKTFNLDALRKDLDFIKFVVDMRTEAAYKKDMLVVDLMVSYLHHIDCQAQLVISPIINTTEAVWTLNDNNTKHLVDWMHEMQGKGINIAAQVQLHKLLGVA
jgi:7-carboxy-7-deazaguanine synthase